MEDRYNNKQSTPSFLNDLIYIEDDILPVETCVKLVNHIDLCIMSGNEPSDDLNRSMIHAYTKRVAGNNPAVDCGNELNNIIKKTLTKYFNSNQIVSEYIKLYKDLIIRDYRR